MARRHPGVERVETIIPKSIHELGPEVEAMYRRHYVLWHWEQLVGEMIAANVRPEKIEYQKLFLYAPSGTWRNEIRMRQPEILQRVNACAGQMVAKELVFTGRWEKKKEPSEHDFQPEPQEINWKRELQKVNLTDAELQELRAACAASEDKRLAETFFRIRIKQKKLERLRLQQGWHPCGNCRTLCPAGEELCFDCRAKQQEKLRAGIRRLLQDIPWARCGELQDYLPGITPYMVNSVRASMVQKLAAHVKLEDMGSMDAKMLVMLYRCLPPEQLNEDVIRRTMYSLRKDLAKPKEFKPYKRYDVIRLGKKNRGNEILKENV